MFQNFKRFRPSLKHILFGGLGGSVGMLGIIFAGALYVVETVRRPKNLAPLTIIHLALMSWTCRLKS